MKNLFNLILVFGLISFMSCGSEDCTIDSFVGEFEGTINCPDDDPASGVLVITKESETTIKVTDIENVEFIMEVSECKATSTVDFFGVMVAQTLTLDGDKIDYRADNMLSGITITCTGAMTRK